MKIKAIILVLIFLILTGCSKKELKEYQKNLEFFDSNINIKLYTTSKDKADNTFNHIKDIYKKYEDILNKDNSNSEISYIYKNNSKDKKIKISTDMNNLIEYGLKLYKDSNGTLSINTGDLIELWNKDYQNNTIPTKEELKNINTDIDKIKIKNNVLDNNHINLDFNQFIKGYINKLTKEYLESVNIDYYFINTGNEVLTGKNINNEDYIIAISNPFNDDVLKVFNVQNKYIVTKSIYYNNYLYDNELYSSIIDAKNKTMTNSMISVTVVGDDIYNTELAANLLFINDYYDGIDIAKKYNVDVIWCYKDSKGKEVIKSNIE